MTKPTLIHLGQFGLTFVDRISVPFKGFVVRQPLVFLFRLSLHAVPVLLQTDYQVRRLAHVEPTIGELQQINVSDSSDELSVGSNRSVIWRDDQG